MDATNFSTHGLTQATQPKGTTMPTLTLDSNGDVLDYNDDGETVEYTQGVGVTTGQSTVGDPNAPQGYSDAEIEAALPYTQGAGSIEQAEIDSLRARETFCANKANEIASYKADGTPVYVRGEAERAQLLRQAKGIRDGLPLQLLMAQRNIATRYLDDQKKVTDAQATLAQHAALETKAREIAFHDEAQELADLMRKRNLGGNRR
jgi:hypothetical protein